MSFILDALKKSESERQRHRGPTVAEIPYGRQRPSQTLWMSVVVALLLVNLGVLTFVLWPKRSETPASAPAATAPAASTPIPAALPPKVAVTLRPANASNSKPAEVRPLAGEAQAQAVAEPFDSSLAASETGEPSEPKLVRAIGAPERAGTQQYPRDSGGNVPTITALGGAGALNLPELHLDIYSYSIEPAKRFAFINMRKYQEGQTLTEGPTVQRIVSDGVVLDYHNQHFLLSRQ